MGMERDQKGNGPAPTTKNSARSESDDTRSEIKGGTGRELPENETYKDASSTARKTKTSFGRQKT